MVAQIADVGVQRYVGAVNYGCRHRQDEHPRSVAKSGKIRPLRSIAFRLVSIPGIDERSANIVGTEFAGVSQDVVQHIRLVEEVIDAAVRLAEMCIKGFRGVGRFTERKINEVGLMRKVCFVTDALT